MKSVSWVRAVVNKGWFGGILCLALSACATGGGRSESWTVEGGAPAGAEVVQQAKVACKYDERIAAASNKRATAVSAARYDWNSLAPNKVSDSLFKEAQDIVNAARACMQGQGLRISLQ